MKKKKKKTNRNDDDNITVYIFISTDADRNLHGLAAQGQSTHLFFTSFTSLRAKKLSSRCYRKPLDTLYFRFSLGRQQKQQHKFKMRTANVNKTNYYYYFK